MKTKVFESFVPLAKFRRYISRLGAALMVTLAALMVQSAVADTLTFQQGVPLPPDPNSYTGLKQTTLYETAPSSVNGGLTTGTWTVDEGDAANDNKTKHALIWFDNIFGSNPGQIPFGSTITLATITANYDDRSSSAFAVHRMLQTWSPATATWNSFTAGVQSDNTEAVAAATTTFSSPNGNVTGTYNAYGTSLTADLQLFSNGIPNYGWVVLPTSGTSGWGWSAAQTNSAVLSVTFTPPSVLTATITSPANSATVGQSFAITAIASAAAPATVTSVTFKDGATVLGVDTTIPYSWSVTGAALGAHVLTAEVTDSNSATATSPPVNVTVIDTPPSVSLISPVGGSSFTVGSNLTLEATASDDVAVTNVEFFVDDVSIGSDNTAPYSAAWNNVPVGAHVLKAVATDGASSTTSALVNVTVAVPILIGPAGSGVQTFDTAPPAIPWSTLSVTGSPADVSSESTMDTAMSSITSANINAVLGTQAGSGTAGNAYWRSGDQKLGTQPTGNKMTLLMATLQNDSGGTLNGLTVAYTLGLALTPGEAIKGHRLYWSMTGAVGSWTPTGTYLRTSPGSTTINANMALPAWANGSILYIVWADDNGATNPDGDYTIDDVSFTPYSGPSATITSPAGGATVGSAFLIEASAFTTGGTITSVTFYDGATPIGTDTTSPYTLPWIGAPLGARALTAVALDSNSLSATSPGVNVTVVAGAGTLTRGPYLQMAGSTQMTIRWRNSLQNLGRVNYGTAAGTLNQTVDEAVAPAAAPASGFDHVVTLTGLSPDTTYFYSIGSGSDTLASGADYTFHTSPVPGTATDTRIWVVGDCGRGNQFQWDVRDAYYSWTGARTPDLCLMLGDNAYESGTDAEYTTGFFDIYPTMFRKMPLWSTLGNHDANNGSTSPTANFPYFDIFTFPTNGEVGGVASGTERYYSFDYGNIHIINLDSQTSNRNTIEGTGSDGPMATWLRVDLASTTKPWIIVMFHHPPYSKGSHDSDTEGQLVQMRTNFAPIFDAGGVDLVLLGHSHSYERSVLLANHYGVSATLTPAMKKNAGSGRPAGDGAYIKPLTGPRDYFGAVYAVAGSAGGVSGGALNHPAMYVSYNTGGTLNLDINGNTLNATYVEKGATMGTFTTPDTFTITKQGASDSDADCIPDAYEIAHGLDRHNSADALLDGDGDGASNLEEFIFSTASNVPDQYVFSSTYNSLAGTTTVTFATATGRTYRVLYSTNLLSWLPASAVIAGTGAPMQWIDDGTATGSLPSATERRFYRIEATAVK